MHGIFSKKNTGKKKSNVNIFRAKLSAVIVVGNVVISKSVEVNIRPHNNKKKEKNKLIYFKTLNVKTYNFVENFVIKAPFISIVVL